MDMEGEVTVSLSMDPGYPFLTTIEDSIESHRICYDAERSRRTGTTIRVDGTK